MKTFYELLSVPREASTDDIKKAFRREIAPRCEEDATRRGAV